MTKNSIFKNKDVINAICIGVLCSVSYLAVYFTRNVLGSVTPQMIEDGFKEEFIGKVSSVYFICYAVGQLINGAIGDKIKPKHMISIGLFMAGVTNFLFAKTAFPSPALAIIIYAITGFFLSMIYGPMTKIIAENTDPVYATRCSLGYTFASFFGSPMAGIAAAVLVWYNVFNASSAFLCLMAIVFFLVCSLFERKKIIVYNQYKPIEKKKGGGIKVLIEHKIIKFTLVSILTGVVRTTVVFWFPTYLSQHLGYTSDEAVSIFAVATFIISFTAFISISIYELLGRKMEKTMLILFISATIFFVLVYFTSSPILNIIFMVCAIISSNGAASMIWSRYCPSLRDTGMVSGATGFLDFVSYIAASVSTTIFANSVSTIGWSGLIITWCVLMIIGVLITLPYNSKNRI